MLDREANWRNHRWSFNSEFTERENAPILSEQLEIYKFFFDDTFYYIIHGKGRYIMRTPHHGSSKNYRVLMEKPRDPFQRKLEDVI